MRNNILKRVKAATYGTPLKIADQCYKISGRLRVEEGLPRYEITPKSIVLVIIADRIDTDDPQAVLQAYADCTSHEDAADDQGADKTDASHDGDDARGNHNKAQRSCILANVVLSPTNQKLVEQIVAGLGQTSGGTTASGMTKSQATKPLPDQPAASNQPDQASAPSQPKKQPQPTETERIEKAIRDALAKASTSEVSEQAEDVDQNDAEFRQIQGFLEQHPEMLHYVLDNHSSLSLRTDQNGQVRAFYKCSSATTCSS